jgi:hypothetical protein
MSVSTLAEPIASTAAMYPRVAGAIRSRFDNALVRYDAWFLVFVAVILALGATLLAGMAIWCVVEQNKTFTGSWQFKDMGLNVHFECV